MNKRHGIYHLYILGIFCLLIFSVINLIRKVYYQNIVASTLLIFNLVNLLKYRSNKNIFFVSLMLCYFNYSVIICRYLFGGTELLQSLYNQLYFTDTLGLSINLLLLFNTIIYIPICIYTKKNDDKEDMFEYKLKIENFKYRKIILTSLKLIIILILFYHVFRGITYNTTLFEYLFIIFIFAFFMSKGEKKEKRTFEILLVLCCIYSLYVGERIGVLQFLISDFVINYLEILKVKSIILITICGIFFFTFMGVYGDILDANNDFSSLTIEKVWDAFSERRFALDTSVSAYFTTSSMIDVSRMIEDNERLENFKEYFSDYLIKGSKSNYKNLPIVVREYQVNYAGGFLIGYFYYWLGIWGVIGISLYIAILFKKVIIIKKTTSNFIKTYSVYFITTLPRWYLYAPSLLFRGSLIFIIIYILINGYVKK